MSSDIEAWPPPNDANAFESLCLDLFKEIWKDAGAQKNGRSGQPQAGVDVFGSLEGNLIGVQCKQRDSLLRSKLTVTELEHEVVQAKKFLPPLSKFIVATTAARDASVQERARFLTIEHKKEGLFSVEVWAWRDLWHELYQRKSLFERIVPMYWPRLARRRRPVVFWAIFAIASFILIGGVAAYFHEARSKPKPHFTVSLRVGNSQGSTVVLTNEFLSMARFSRVADLPNGAFVFNASVDGCIVIPVERGESNAVFSLTAENASSVKVNDLQAAVAFPKDWVCSADPKWHHADLFGVLPGRWKLTLTNLQAWAVQSSWVMFPWDVCEFPCITNSCVATYTGPGSKAGCILVSLRSSDYEDVIGANILFFPSSSNFSKPFVTREVLIPPEACTSTSLTLPD